MVNLGLRLRFSSLLCKVQNARILLVEDEESLMDIIKLNLELEGYVVYTAITGVEALKEIRSKRFDLVLLDVMLPEIDGFAICQTLRLENNNVPILFITAKNSNEDRVFGLKIGADDYLAKPFDLEELLLRIQLLLRRNKKEGNISPTFEFEGCKVDFTSFEITDIQGERHTLTKKEIMLLRLLIERKNEVISREQILDTVWGYNSYPNTRTIDNIMVGFRKHFEHDPKNPKHFISIRGVGYKFTDTNY